MHTHLCNMTLQLFPLREKIYFFTPRIWFDLLWPVGYLPVWYGRLENVHLLGLVFSCFQESCPHMSKPGLASWRRRGHKDRGPACLTHPSDGVRQGSEVLLGHMASAKPIQSSSTAKVTHNSDKYCKLCFGVPCYIAKANSYSIYSLLEWFSFLIYSKSLEAQTLIQSKYLALRICLYLGDRINCSW